MQLINIKSFIKSLEITVPDDKEFLKLSELTPMYSDNVEAHRINYERGILLYALVAKYKPQNVLEIGTAKGYSTLCMAWAMHDYDIPGTIYAIDPVLDTKFEIEINGEIDILTTPQLWEKIAPSEWISKIKPIAGYSGEIMHKHKFPQIDFAYIDGHHVYEAVKHDFYAFLKTSSKDFRILFDDYALSDGVTNFIDNDISKNFDGLLIKTDTEHSYKELDLDLNSKFNIYHAMCWFESNSLKKPLQQVYPIHKINNILKKYRKFEKRWIFRQKINQKIPILKNLRFSKYFHR
jgi:hypothetical protein